MCISLKFVVSIFILYEYVIYYLIYVIIIEYDFSLCKT